MPGWSYQEIPTAHNAMMLMPDQLTAMLESIGAVRSLRGVRQ